MMTTLRAMRWTRTRRPLLSLTLSTTRSTRTPSILPLPLPLLLRHDVLIPRHDS